MNIARCAAAMLVLATAAFAAAQDVASKADGDAEPAPLPAPVPGPIAAVPGVIAPVEGDIIFGGDKTPPGVVVLTLTPNGDSAVDVTWTEAGDNNFVAGTYTTSNSLVLKTAATYVGTVATTYENVFVLLPAPSVAGTVTTVTVPVAPQGTYTFTMTCTDDKGNSSTSLPATISFDTMAPSTVLGLAATEVGLDSITLAWASAGDSGVDGFAATYSLYATHATFAAGQEAQMIADPATTKYEIAGDGATVFPVGGLDSSTTYLFTITASDENGNTSAPSAFTQAATASYVAAVEGAANSRNCSATGGIPLVLFAAAAIAIALRR